MGHDPRTYYGFDPQGYRYSQNGGYHFAPMAGQPMPTFVAPTTCYAASNAPRFVPVFPVERSSTIYIPTTQVACFGYVVPVGHMLSNPSCDQRMTAMRRVETKVYNIEEYVKQAIQHSIGHRYNDPNPCRTDIKLDSFLFELCDSATSLSIPTETHLKWFAEFAGLYSHVVYSENLVNYFDYIKEYHLNKETEFSPSLIACIDNVIDGLIINRCCVPEIISSLVEMVGKDMNQRRADHRYIALKTSILENEGYLSFHGFARYLKVLESFLQFIPHLPLHIIFINKRETRIGHLRLIFHFSHLYKVLMGFEDSSPQQIHSAIQRAYHYSDGSYINNLGYEKFRVFDRLIKQFFLRMFHSKSKQSDVIFERFENVAEFFIKIFHPSHIKRFIADHFDNLLDFYLYFSSSKMEKSIDFVEFVFLSYTSDPFEELSSLNQILLCISYYGITLDQFREEHKELILGFGVDQDFVLVLEAIIAAVEDIESNVFFYETWEPSSELLELQAQIISRRNRPGARFSSIESHYLMFAARIFLSRVTGFPLSIFPTSAFLNEDYSWEDALDFVNFYFEKGFFGDIKSSKVRSQFFEDLKVEFGNSPTLDQMITLRAERDYPNIKKTIVELNI